jgi:DNA-binding transcriptional MerR regulator
MAELSNVTGVTVATLKYYLREGVLPAGVATAVNQAEYHADHVRRVRLIRALLDLAGLGMADVRNVVAAVDDDETNIHDAFGLAQDAMVPHRRREGDLFTRALAEANRFVARHGLHVRPAAQVRTMLADALAALSGYGFEGLPVTDDGVVDSSVFDAWVPGLLQQAAAEVGVAAGLPRDEQMGVSVVGTIGFEVAAAAVRRMALEHASALRFGE